MILHKHPSANPQAVVSPISICVRPFGVIDDDRVERCRKSFELEAELLLHCGEETRKGRVFLVGRNIFADEFKSEIVRTGEPRFIEGRTACVAFELTFDQLLDGHVRGDEAGANSASGRNFKAGFRSGVARPQITELGSALSDDQIVDRCFWTW
jgi:hypothetical protein